MQNRRTLWAAILSAALAVWIGLLLRGLPPYSASPRPLVTLPAPQGLAASPQGYLFASSANGQILDVVARQTSVPLANTGGQPAGLAFDAAGTLYVADPARRAILKISPSGEIRTFAEQCEGVPIQSPAHLALAPNGDLFFTDTAASRVYRADPSGRVAIFTAEVPAPTGIAVSAASGRVFVAGEARRIWTFDPETKTRHELAALDRKGAPAGMALDEQGNLYIAREGAAVSVLNPAGRLLQTFDLPRKRVTALAFGGPDLQNLYVAASDPDGIYKFRALARAQRLPWEPNDPLRITEPVDGAILNRHDGEFTPAGLRIRVQGRSAAGASVSINGAPTPVHEGTFQTTLVLANRSTTITAESADARRHQVTVFWDRDSFPRYRMSTDDNILFFKDIAQHADTYRSLFDNAYLAFWREMHRKYGAKVHFNIYYETPGFQLSQMPDKYRPEWQANADWIRLSFHARANEPDRPYLHASAEKIRGDYRLVMQEIARFAGPQLQSPVTTVHWGAATREAMQALHEEGVRGLVGYFDSRDDLPSVCYYLPLAQWRYLSGRDYWKDTREDLLFLRHDIVINMFPLDQIVPRLEQIAADPHQSEIIGAHDSRAVLPPRLRRLRARLPPARRASPRLGHPARLPARLLQSRTARQCVALGHVEPGRCTATNRPVIPPTRLAPLARILADHPAPSP